VPLYLRPTLLSRGRDAEAAIAAGVALRLAGGPVAFAALEIAERDGEGIERRLLPLAEARRWIDSQPAVRRDAAAATLAQLVAERPAFAGMALDKPRLMGVVNVTPDSFSDGGDHADSEAAIAHAVALLEAGADLLDIGGESTRPGSAPVPGEIEIARVEPVIRALAGRGALVSIDSRHAAVMKAALAAGARLVNDVTALAGDADSLGLVAEAGVPAVLMHMQGEPATMQRAPRYDDAPLDLYDYFAGRLAACAAAGIDRQAVAIDPGIGFGKNSAHNLDLIDRLALFHGLGCPLVLGVSRKSFIGRLSRREPAKERLAGSLAAALAGADRGAQIIRVHDVAETRQARALWLALADPGSASA
jgi:dihydropteroate synthase